MSSLDALCLALALASSGLLAADWKDIEGSYVISGTSYLDPDPNEPKNTHLWLQLHGKAAEDLYRAMQVLPEKDDCTGAQRKIIGNMGCLHFASSGASSARYECSFSINLRDQSIGHGIAC